MSFDLFSSVGQVLECCWGGCPQELALALQHVDSAESFLDIIFPSGGASSSFALRVIQITAWCWLGSWYMSLRGTKRTATPAQQMV